MREIWASIEGFEGLYEVSNTGKVKALERLVLNNGGMQHKHERILKPNYSNTNKRGMVVLCKEGKTYPRLVHRLVAVAFIPNHDGKPCVDHIDTNPANNHADNLRWVTVKENANNPLTRKHISASKMGHSGTLTHHTEATREKLRLLNLGRKPSEEARKRMSEAHKGKPHPNCHRGKHWKVEGGKRIWY